MENLHLKNLDLTKINKKMKNNKVKRKVIQDTEDNKNVLFESSVKLLMIGWVAVGLTFAFTHPYFVIEIGRSLYKIGELIFGL